MKKDLSIFTKGLIVVAAPFLFQMVVIFALFGVQAESFEAQKWSFHTKEIISEADTTLRLLTEAQSTVRALAVIGDPVFLEDFHVLEQGISNQIERLAALVRDNQPQLERTERIENGTKRLTAWLETIVEFIHANRSEEAVATMRDPTGRQLMKSLRDELDAFVRVESDVDVERTEALRRSWTAQNWFLIGAAVLSAVTAVLVFGAYHRGIVRRLAVLTVNADRLAAREPLEVPLGGKDEIAKVDRAFHAAARALEERDVENEMFIYSVSHDLRSPLVNLQGFSRELSESTIELRRIVNGDTFGDVDRFRVDKLIDSDVATSIRFIQTAVSRLAGIIDSLLRLSRIGRVEFRLQPLDMQQLVQRVVESLKVTAREQRAEISVADLPPAWGDTTAVEQIVANLLTNGLRYADSTRTGRLEVGSTSDADQPGMRTYFVRDNGVGIPELYHHKLFLAFQRLHPELASGEGIGLALVRRSIERHGGRVWAESIEGEGSTFYFTLPIEQPTKLQAGSTQRIYGEGEKAA